MRFPASSTSCCGCTGRIESPEALAGYSALSWLGGESGAETMGPLLWPAPPQERFANAFLAVADALAEGRIYPAPDWWRAEVGCLAPMTATQWNERAESLPERYYAHGVVCALGWVLGIFNDPAILAPLHNGDGSSVGYGAREEWRVRLRACAVPDPSRARAWVIPPEVGVVQPSSQLPQDSSASDSRTMTSS